MAGYDHSNVIASLTSPTSIQSATSTALTFVGDVTGDGIIDQVTYQLSGTQFLRKIASWSVSAFPTQTSGTIADGFTNLSFSYFDANDNAIAAPVASTSLANIKRITVSINPTNAGVRS
jgi:hypothetical protein